MTAQLGATLAVGVKQRIPKLKHLLSQQPLSAGLGDYWPTILVLTFVTVNRFIMGLIAGAAGGWL